MNNMLDVSKMLNNMRYYIKRQYFYNILENSYESKIIDHNNYFEIILLENNISFKAIFSNKGILLYCYLTTEKVIDCMDDDNFFVIDFKCGTIENVLHFQYRNNVLWLEGSARGISDKLVDYSRKDNSFIYERVKNDLLDSSNKRRNVRKKVKNN